MKRTIIAVLLAALVIGTAACQTGELGGPSQTGRQNIRGIAIDYAGSNAALDVDQRGTGNELIVRDAQTPVARIADGGAMDLYSPKNQHKLMIKAASTQSTPPFILQNSSGTAVASFDNAGNLTAASVVGSTSNDLNGEKLTIDADADTWIDESADDIIDLALGAAAGYWNVLTGNLKVGNGTPDVTMDGEDAYVEGTLEVDGASRFDGAVVNQSTTQLVGAVNLDGAVDLDGVVTNAANLEHILFPTWLTVPFTYTAAAGGTITLATAGASEIWYVQDVRVHVTTNFDATGDDVTIDIGRDEDVDGFCVLVDAELQTADTEGTGWDAGWQCQVAATRGVFLDGTGGYILNGSETIDAVIDETSGETITAGAATVYILYTRLQ